MAENSTKKSAVFKTFPIDISNTFIQAYNGEEVVVIGTNYTSQHDNISNTPLLYVSGDSQFHKNVIYSKIVFFILIFPAMYYQPVLNIQKFSILVV